MGCAFVDEDKIAHEMLDEDDVREKIVGLFGQGILDSAGKIDHEKLAAIVFANTEKLSSLNEIIHPLVLERAEQLIRQYEGQSRVRAIVLDIPLLAEVGWEKRCDKLVFVDCKRRLRTKRAKKTGIFDENQIKIRENFQISLDNKATVSDNTIDNNSGFSALAGQVADIFSNIIDNS